MKENIIRNKELENHMLTTELNKLKIETTTPSENINFQINDITI